MQIGNTIKLNSDPDNSEKLFKIKSFDQFVNCISVIAANLRKRGQLNVQLVSNDRFRFTEMRAAYFSWLTEICTGAESPGAVKETHLELKSKFLLPIVCESNPEFAEFVIRNTHDGITDQQIINMLSVADASITSSQMMSRYIDECKKWWDTRYDTDSA